MYRPPTFSTNVGTVVQLPLGQVAGSPSTVTGTIDQLEMQIDPNSYTVMETSRKRGGVSRGGRTESERKRDLRKNRTPEETQEIEKIDRKAETGKKQREGAVRLDNLTTTSSSLKHR